ncbi:MAG: MlaD family protein [Candidatus Cloacimonetes bacterium]|nr:MlaD family protein [Candidatus Cloacimonadota bacterium]
MSEKFYPKLQQIQFKVGLWAILIIIALFVSFAWLTDKVSTRKQSEIQVLFSDVQGLEIGDKITYRGMEAGRIKSVKISEDGVVVTGKINSELKLTEGARFFVQDSSLMGGKMLSILPGNSDKPLNLKQRQNGEAGGGIFSMINQAGDLISSLQQVLAQVSEDDGIIDRSKSLLGNTDSAVQNLDQQGRNLVMELSNTIRSIQSATRQVNGIVSRNEENLDELMQKTPEVVGNISATMDSLQILSARLNGTIKDLNEGKGSAGKVLSNDELHAKLLESINNLDLLIKDIKENPKKYVKFSLF